MEYKQVIAAWNEQADGENDWSVLGEDEKIEFAMKLARDDCAKIVDHIIKPYYGGKSYGDFIRASTTNEPR